MNTIKQVVDSLVAAGTPLSDIIRQVNVAAVDKALVMNYGNQTKAAQQIGCHRSIIRKYTLVRQEKRVVGRWRDNTGEPVIRKGKIQIEYIDGFVTETYASKINWIQENSRIVRWRPWYA
jgi:hypothetical protein